MLGYLNALGVMCVIGVYLDFLYVLLVCGYPDASLWHSSACLPSSFTVAITPHYLKTLFVLLGVRFVALGIILVA